LGLLVFGLGHELIANVLLGPQYRTSSSLMGWVALGYSFFMIAQVYERVFYARHEPRFVAVSQATGAFLSAAIGLPAIFFFGLLGAAAAVPIYFGGQLIVTTWLARRDMRSTAATVMRRVPSTRDSND
jgi:O-antigen/teichoic acid export membrane protein